jgi:hypothetical protein
LWPSGGQPVAAGEVIPLAATANLTYQPATNYTGADSFQWFGFDGQVYTSSAATVNITTDPELVPIVTNGTLSLAENHIVAFSDAMFGAHFFDFVSNPDGQDLRAIQITALPGHGVLSLSGQPVAAGRVIPASQLSDLVYQPPANYTGQDSFQWTGSDGQFYAASPAAMTLSIGADNPPHVSSSTASMVENQTNAVSPADFTAAFSDPDAGDTLQAFKITSLPADGQLQLSGTPVTAYEIIYGSDISDLTYVPDTGFTGQDAFQWTASDGQLYAAAPATMTLSVGPVNQPPNFTAGATQTVLQDAGPQTVPGWATNIADGAGDLPGQTLSFVVISNTNPGLFAIAPSVDPATGNLSFTTAPNTSGTGTISIVLKDSDGTANRGQDNSAVQTFTINVNAFVAENDSESTSALTFSTADFTGRFSDSDCGNTLQSIQITALPQSGTLALSGTAVTVGQVISVSGLSNLTYQPNTGFNGTESFQWAGSADGQDYGSPQGFPVTTAMAVAPGQSVSFSASDFQGQCSATLQSVQINTLPQHGTLLLSGQSLTAGATIAAADISNLSYQPTTGFRGQDSFEWSGSNTQGESIDPTMFFCVTPAADGDGLSGDGADTARSIAQILNSWGYISDSFPLDGSVIVTETPISNALGEGYELELIGNVTTTASFFDASNFGQTYLQELAFENDVGMCPKDYFQPGVQLFSSNGTQLPAVGMTTWPGQGCGISPTQSDFGASFWAPKSSVAVIDLSVFYQKAPPLGDGSIDLGPPPLWLLNGMNCLPQAVHLLADFLFDKFGEGYIPGPLPEKQPTSSVPAPELFPPGFQTVDPVPGKYHFKIGSATIGIGLNVTASGVSHGHFGSPPVFGGLGIEFGPSP